ncbi:hypothetical protein GA0115240_10595 [Streptomyces sp. DvalAA-14]|uniref:hypothetical protein n=1 Tax=unclassified Streptomyces TaxID=2593676 RepID=UPI00081B3659|nr:MULTISPECIES: hypothetical protein [unclassified Streptomyces]MYS19184.1 hypothetical protein [Streptomyces sp. SID4948]SCD38605.1 hypothetical protein GA0115240_10595 [Streptomyces sp. DvalAA-14]
MSLHDDLTSVQRRLDDLMRCVARLDEHTGDSLDMRRVRADAGHLRESLNLLQDSVPLAAGNRTVEMVSIPDAPYDRGLWTDAEDEGLGSPHRHAP